MLEITNELVKLLVCPLSRGKLYYDRERSELVSIEATCAFPIKDGVPLLLPEHARKMKDEELIKFRQDAVNV
jgi:uncharacterized protein YbaR (Trm112 family)